MDAIVFDWDGTLVDSFEPLYRSNIAVLASYGIDLDEVVYRQAYTPDWRRMYLDLGVPKASIEEAAQRWRDAYGFGDGAAAFPGVAAALERLTQAGLRLGVVTAGDRRVVAEQARLFGLDELLPVRVHADDLPWVKPHPEPLRHALRSLGVHDPGRAAYLGDVPDDMRMARAAGSKAFGVVGRLGTREELFEAGAENVHGSVVEFVDAFLGTRAASQAAAT
jgi:HAD superfamily hydrolase (TIGR01549 family)